MSNMSYCRFQNTASDLEDCVEAIENGKIDELSQDEIYGLQSIQDLAREIISLSCKIEEGIEESEKYNEDE